MQSAATFIATVAGSFGTPSGLVTFLDGTIALGTASLDAFGQASLTTSGLMIGTHSVTASYSGDPTYNSSASAARAHTVSGRSLNVSVATSNASVNYGTAVTFTATLSTAPGAGLVVFYANGNAIGIDSVSGGTASFTTGSLARGSYTILAKFAGSGLFAPAASAAISQTVN